MRALVGLVAQAALTSGLAFIQDMFFFHEHTRKIGIWAAVFLFAPYFGPLWGNFIVAGTGNWRIVQWIVFVVGALNIILMILFLDEPWYRRDIPAINQPARGHRIFRLLGTWQLRVHRQYFDSLGKSILRLILVAVRPVVFLIFIY